MSALYLLVGISLLVAIVFLFAFLWAMKAGQYDDDYTPSIRMLFETSSSPEEKLPQPENSNIFCKTYKNNKLINN